MNYSVTYKLAFSTDWSCYLTFMLRGLYTGKIFNLTYYNGAPVAGILNFMIDIDVINSPVYIPKSAWLHCWDNAKCLFSRIWTSDRSLKMMGQFFFKFSRTLQTGKILVLEVCSKCKPVALSLETTDWLGKLISLGRKMRWYTLSTSKLCYSFL